MSIELFVLITLVVIFIGIMLVRSRLSGDFVNLFILLALFASFPISIYMDRLFAKIWFGGQLLVVAYSLYDLYNKSKAVRRYPGALSKYKVNPDMSKWRPEEVQYYQSTYLTGTDESNKALIDLVYADMKAVRKIFLPYVAGMKRVRKVALYVVPNEGCLWDIEDNKGN